MLLCFKRAKKSTKSSIYPAGYSPIFCDAKERFIFQTDKGKNEIPMRKFSHQPKMNIWVFHATIKKQIIYA
jgi:hypothetical protein